MQRVAIDKVAKQVKENSGKLDKCVALKDSEGEHSDWDDASYTRVTYGPNKSTGNNSIVATFTIPLNSSIDLKTV